MNKQIKIKWDKHYNTDTKELPEAAKVLFQNQHLLPKQGTALDLACGRGANAICLIENGLTVSAWDISESALEQLSFHTKEKKLNINLEIRDVSKSPPKANTFDVIVVSRFLDRHLISDIRDAIKPKGLIFYQTFTKEKTNDLGPKNPDYLLDNNELLAFFDDWKVICYREEGQNGNIVEGFRNEALIIAQKP